MNNSGKFFSDEFTEWLIEVGFIQYQCQMPIHYKYVPYGKKIFLSYVDYYVYWYTSESHVKWLLDTLTKRFRVNFLGYSHWFFSINISQMKDHTISVYKSRYDTYIVTKY